ncbi:MAG: Gfo/Idh/MocA family oxidoreductase, partial [Victivallales bacterium]|nr:Gfo/Idh/MocA family oxidoreductase [Victivallales bacterium]
MNIAIVGFAHGHYGAYCRQWAAHPEWDIIPTKGWDHDTARLTQNAQNLKLDAVESLDDLVKDTSIDAFLITAETSLHADLVEAIAP